MAQRIVEKLIGLLIADEQFRTEFLTNPEGTLSQLCDRGLDLTKTEITALVNTDRRLWSRAAESLDPRLQKASLHNQLVSQKESAHHG